MYYFCCAQSLQRGLNWLLRFRAIFRLLIYCFDFVNGFVDVSAIERKESTIILKLNKFISFIVDLISDILDYALLSDLLRHLLINPLFILSTNVLQNRVLKVVIFPSVFQISLNLMYFCAKYYSLFHRNCVFIILFVLPFCLWISTNFFG
jgi:hypothetical protein